MSIPRSVKEILSEHVTLELECIDQMYLNVLAPRLQREAGVAGFFSDSLRAPVYIQRTDGSD